MSPKVIWVRHGTCRDGLERPNAHARPDSPLSDLGREQLVATAEDIRGRLAVPPLLVSSPLRRACESAAVLAPLLAAVTPLPVHAEFVEWRAPDCVLGRSAEEYPECYVRWRKRRAVEVESALPGGESLAAFAQRAERARKLARALGERYGAVVVVSHRLLIGAVCGLAGGVQGAGALFEFCCGFRLAGGGVVSMP